MRREVARLGRQAGQARGSLMRFLQPLQRRVELDAREQGPRLVAAEAAQPVDADIEAVELDVVERRSEGIRLYGINIARETQGNVIVFRIDPASASKFSSQQRQPIHGSGGKFETGKQ